jgi:mannose-1-phosphate guanylyltransferase/mannose-6-phosphate isomerase
MPKQFIPLFGKESTFQRTMKLLAERSVFDRPIVITNAEYRFTVADQLKAIGVDAQIVLEPMRRDSAPAVAAAVELGLARDPKAVVGVFAADHVVQDSALFVETCAKAGRVAAEGRIVTIGVPSSYPATGYGYIRPSEEIDGAAARRVAAFVEKPDAARAARYLAEGYLWNSGNFIFDAATMRAELEQFVPEVIGPVADAVKKAAPDLEFLVLDAEAFSATQKISIDYAVMERTSVAAVVAGGFGWSDVGGWAAVWDLAEKDGDGNAVQGRGYVLEGRNNLVRAEAGVVAVVGLDDVAVIATCDATLVVPKDRADKVKEMVGLLAARGEAEAAEHREIARPWGKYLSIDMGERYQVKRITVKPGGLPRRSISAVSSRATRRPEIEVSGIAARHSRVTSSTMLRIRNRRPQANWSWTKSRDRRALATASTRIGARVPTARRRVRRLRTVRPSSR